MVAALLVAGLAVASRGVVASNAAGDAARARPAESAPVDAKSVAATSAPEKPLAKPRVGRKIESFALRDFRGKETNLDEFKDAKLLVVGFFGTECPLVNQYAGPLQAIADKYKDRGVATIVINPNVQDSIAEVAHWTELHKLTLPVLKDPSGAVADQFAAERTPEIFVLDADRIVRYAGRIDDQFGVGFQRPKATEHYLVAALDELLAGKAVSKAETDAVGCRIGRARTPDETSKVTYSNQIARIFEKRCVECHREGEIAPFPLRTYEESFGWAAMIDEVVSDLRMPPWNADPAHGKFKNDARLSDEEKQQIHQWVKAGAPQGDPKELPEPRKFTVGWRIPEPQQVVKITPQPFKVPAKGQVNYQYFVVDPGFKEDKWIRAAEIRPGNRGVVHHIIAFIRTPNAGPPDGEHPGGRPAQMKNTIESDWLVAFAPGSQPMNFPTGLGKFVPAGSKLVFQVHYTPNGSPQTDQSTLGLVFADARTVKKEVGTWRAVNPKFAIPAGDSNYEVKAQHVFRKDTLLLAMFPHMHLRGKSFRYEVVYPDGKQEVLLDVPRYDFGWQNSYILAEPKRLPAGTKLICTAHYDNSESNLSNPDPAATVRWGDQTWEEMMIGYFSMILADQDLTAHPIGQRRADDFQQRIKRGEQPQLTDALRKQAGEALASPEALTAFAGALGKVVPQLDRIDVSTVSDGKLYLRQTSKTGDAGTKADIAGFSIDAKGMALAEHALAGKPATHAKLAQETALDLRFRSKTMGSSTHIPVTLDGQKGTINFWSTETDAFSDDAVKFLTEAAAAMMKK
jgi:peroxiredoxin/mono/diheme cytochrome c family protein